MQTAKLTWEDVKRIVKIADHIITHETGHYPTERTYYEEVLKRYNNDKTNP